MILEKETLESVGKDFDHAPKKAKIVCRCDYCGVVFKRNKHNIERSWTHNNTDSCSNIICVQKKRVETNRKLFGTDNSFQSEEVKKKIVSSNIEKYGVPNVSQNKKIQEKRSEACIKKYGVPNVFANADIKDKIKKTNLDKLGVTNPMKHESIKNKHHDTMIEKYGVPHALQNTEFRKKAIETCITNHGVFPASNYGKTQNEIKDWLNSFGFDFKSNRTLMPGFEIDLYDSTKQLAIEYCGLHWHHELSIEPRKWDYHWKKYKTCLAQGVQLLTIFSDEWLNRGDQCRGHIKSILGITNKKVFARKCSVSEINSKEGRDFFDKYHIQGKNNLGYIFFGLYNDNELLGAISLGRHNRQIDAVVLDRLCFKDGVQVIGGAGKLFTKCVEWARTKGHKEILSFSDNRWSIGKVYEALKFTLDKEYRPDYSYVKITRATERLSKQSQKKNAECPKGTTEHEWAIQRGLSRIWDCGKKRWVFYM